MDLGIEGKSALVLGASKGLGRASAEALALEGVKVIAAARNVESAAFGPGIEGINADLSDEQSVDKLIEAVLNRGGVDILVNNTGGPKPGQAGTQTSQDWRATFDVLALPMFHITAGLLPSMQERQWGRIITIGSSGIVQPIPGLALSNAIRAAVSGWSKTLAAEVARDGITVNMVLPGRIDTDRVRSLDRAKAERTGDELAVVQQVSKSEIPVGRYGLPEEFGSVVAFVSSTLASYVTGSMIAVDGGAIRGLR